MRIHLFKNVIVIILLSLLIAAGCDDDQIQNPGGQPDEVVTTLSITPRRVRLGDELSILYRVTNYSADTVTFNFGIIQQFGYTITTPDGDKIYHPYFVSPALSQFILFPGQEKRFKRSFSTVADGDNIRWPHDLDRLPVGLHSIEAGLLQHDEDYPWSKTYFWVVK